MTGGTAQWFGVGFALDSADGDMAGKYAVVVDWKGEGRLAQRIGDADVSEHALGDHGAGSELAKSVEVKTQFAMPDFRRNVLLERPLAGAY